MRQGGRYQTDPKTGEVKRVAHTQPRDEKALKARRKALAPPAAAAPKPAAQKKEPN